jgi:hypothetical protein
LAAKQGLEKATADVAEGANAVPSVLGLGELRRARRIRSLFRPFAAARGRWSISRNPPTLSRP